MEQKKVKSLNYYMRVLHRDAGFFTLGLIVIYALSGIVLVYRDTNFLKHEVTSKKKISPNMKASELGRTLHMKKFKVSKTEGGIIYFKNGTYNKTNGIAIYTAHELYFPLNKFVKLHKTSTKSSIHLVTVTFGLLVLFMGISSFWMFKRTTNLFRRGIYFSGAGILLAGILLAI